MIRHVILAMLCLPFASCSATGTGTRERSMQACTYVISAGPYDAGGVHTTDGREFRFPGMRVTCAACGKTLEIWSPDWGLWQKLHEVAAQRTAFTIQDVTCTTTGDADGIKVYARQFAFPER